MLRIAGQNGVATVAGGPQTLPASPFQHGVGFSECAMVRGVCAVCGPTPCSSGLFCGRCFQGGSGLQRYQTGAVRGIRIRTIPEKLCLSQPDASDKPQTNQASTSGDNESDPAKRHLSLNAEWWPWIRRVLTRSNRSRRGNKQAHGDLGVIPRASRHDDKLRLINGLLGTNRQHTNGRGHRTF